MPGRIHHVLSADHERLDAALHRATAGSTIDMRAYHEFRGGLLRHIAMEEKVLFVDARTRAGDAVRRVLARLHADHAALASLLVAPPTHDLLATVRAILVEHNPLEEDTGGIYDVCERLAGSDIEAVLARMHAIPPARVAELRDEPRIHAHIARMLAARARYDAPAMTNATPAGQLMQPNALTIPRAMPVLEIQRLFVTANIGGAPVVDERGDVVGMIEAADLLRAIDQALDEDIDPGEADGDALAGELGSLTAADILAPHVTWVDMSTPVSRVANVMRAECVHRVLVRDEAGRLAGILTTFDLLAALGDDPVVA